MWSTGEPQPEFSALINAGKVRGDVLGTRALLEAKRLGPGRFSVGVAGPHVVPGGTTERKAVSQEARRATDLLLPRVVQLLDRHPPPDTVSALEILAVQVHNAINAAASSLSVTTEGGMGIRTIRGVHSVRDQISGLLND